MSAKTASWTPLVCGEPGPVRVHDQDVGPPPDSSLHWTDNVTAPLVGVHENAAVTGVPPPPPPPPVFVAAMIPVLTGNCEDAETLIVDPTMFEMIGVTIPNEQVSDTVAESPTL